MANFIKSACVLVIYLVVRSECATVVKYVPSNSSNLSYLSNGIQFPVQPVDDHNLVIEATIPGKMPDMQWLSQLYNHHFWEKRLVALENLQCQSHMSTYLSQLQNGTTWAIKMHDASGRYSSQFFFGNDYWLGSNTLCKELQLPEENTLVPPFPVHFYVARIRININENLTPVTRQLNLGQCLPSSCNISDVRRLLIQEPSQVTSLSVVGVRAVPGDYSMLHDFKFHIIGGVAASVLVIVLISTVIEYFFNKKRSLEKPDIEEANNKNNNVSIGIENSLISPNIKLQKCNSKSKCRAIADFITQLLLCFSALKNGKKILDVSPTTEGSIKCLHGLRFFSIAWITLVHTYLAVFAIADNKSVRIVAERKFFYQTISNATFSVDTFFFISGLLVTITYLRKESNTSSKSSNENNKVAGSLKSNFAKYFVVLFYRYIRLTPAYLFVLGLNELVMRYYHSNSVFSPAILDHISCAQYWWRNALYINNFYPQGEFCMLWSWYMSNDTQFFVVAIILLAVGIRNERCFRWVAGAILVFLISSWITTFTIAMQYNYVARIEEPFALFDQLYDKPWLRVSPYLVGMATGYALTKIDFKLILPKALVLLGWILSLMCMVSLIYGLGKDGLVVPISAFYASLGHTAWGLSLAWLTIACCTGYGGPINAALTFRGLLPLSRLTYCAYLVHPIIMRITSFQMDGPIHLGITLVIYFGNMVVSFLVAFVISLGFEAPCIRLLQLLSKKSK